LPQIGRPSSSGFPVLFVHGVVNILPKDTPPATLHGLITRSGGEMINLP
jgi:hypothetical protein